MVVPDLGDWCIVTLVDGSDSTYGDWRRHLRDIGTWHVDPAARDLVEQYVLRRLDALDGDSYLARALRSTGPVVMTEDATDSIASALAPGEARDALLALRPRSAVVVPMRARGRTLGLLSVFHGPDRAPVTSDGVKVVEEISARAGLALDNTRLYRQQRDLAEDLQRSMMTAPPQPDDLEIAVRYVPAAEAAQVGGDWYDAFMVGDSTLLVIGDVVGHDTAAAAAMGQLRNIMRGVAVATKASPAALLRQVDTALADLDIETTATVVVTRLEQTPEERRAGLTRLRWSNAGHPPPVVVVPREPGPPDGTTGGARAEVLRGPQPNLLLGLVPDVERDEPQVTLRRGSTVLLYTDGLVERRGEPIDRGVGRLTDALALLVDAGLGLEELCDELLRRMLPDDPSDDVALVAVRLHAQDSVARGTTRSG
jgi:serine phosphatase RsbU (regulator of sigma subunit)